MPGVPGAKQFRPARPDGMKGEPPRPGQGMRPPVVPAGEGPAPAAPRVPRTPPMGDPRAVAGMQKAARPYPGTAPVAPTGGPPTAPVTPRPRVPGMGVNR